MKLLELRHSFWLDHPEYKKDYRVSYRQNQYSADIRLAWCDYVEFMRSSDLITEKMAQRATL